MPQVSAIPIDGVRSEITSDGRVGLLRFQRARPDSGGSRELNLALPVPLLPYVASVALEIMPQGDKADGGLHPAVIEARAVQLGLARGGDIVLTIEMEVGARISFSIDQAQAESLQQALSIGLGRRRAQALRATAAATVARPTGKS